MYAALGKAARDRPAYEAIVGALKDLRDEETLIVQSGKPIGHPDHARARAARAHGELQHRRPLGQ